MHPFVMGRNAALLLAVLVLLSACANDNIVKKENYTGFLSDYSMLKTTTLDSGRIVSRWVDPALYKRGYRSLIIEPVQFYPRPHVQDQVSRQVLLEIKQEMNRRVKKIAKINHMPLSRTPAAGVLRLRSAITSVKVSDEEFSVNELIPLRLIISGLEMMSGGRDREVSIYFEYEMLDSLTNQILVRGIRKGKTLELANSDEKLSLENAQPLLDKWGMDFQHGFVELKGILKNRK